jgi:hypothetical protein
MLTIHLYLLAHRVSLLFQLDYGADLRVTNHRGWTPLDAAANDTVKARLASYNPLSHLQKKLDQAYTQIDELRQEVQVLKRSVIFLGNVAPSGGYSNATSQHASSREFAWTESSSSNDRSICYCPRFCLPSWPCGAPRIDPP